jgi:hypothetical protein
MENSKTLLCSLKFPWVIERAPSKFVDSLGTSPQKGSPGLFYIPQILQFLFTLLLLINSKGKMFNFLKFKLGNVLNSNSIWKRMISQTTQREVKYIFEDCSLHFFISFFFCEVTEKVLSVFNRHNIRKQESFLATRKLESQFLEEEIFPLLSMSEYHSPLGISFQ